MNVHISTSENTLSVHVYRRGNASCLLSHLSYLTVDAVSKKMRRLDTLLQQLNAPSWLQSAGHPSWSFLLIGDSANHSSWLLKSYFIQELCKRGILSLGSHNLNLNLAHSEQDVHTLLSVPVLIRLDADKAIHQSLDGEPIQPVFKVR